MATPVSSEAVVDRYRILVVDDHPILREGLVHLIGRQPDLFVCGEAEDVQQALQAVTALSPDLVVVDLTLRHSSGLDLIKTLHAQMPALPILVLSIHDEMLYARRALRAGARGYVMKREEPETVLHAVRKVLHGDIYVSERMTSQLLQGYLKGEPATVETPLAQLSDRELEVLGFIGQGYTTSQIAQTLHLSDKTVWTHRAHIMEKLQLQNATELLRYALHWFESLNTKLENP